MSFPLWAQDSAEETALFGRQAGAVLRSVGTEAYNKVAYDFENAWNTKFQSDHKKKIKDIALLMQKRGYPRFPYFQHFYAYLAFAVSQEGIQAIELNQILDINLQSVHSLNREQYADFLFELNTFFGQRYLHWSRNIVTQANEGSYSFELVGSVENKEALAV
ncbi:MAG: hypothetical protein OEY56_06010, partial [Cyclobacteriaceae bacterium]|nr:hypothetical protein [Cyclobacteriaceae bacterium]